MCHATTPTEAAAKATRRASNKVLKTEQKGSLRKLLALQSSGYAICFAKSRTVLEAPYRSLSSTLTDLETWWPLERSEIDDVGVGKS